VDIHETSVSSAPYARCLEVRHPAGELAGELVSASAKTEWGNLGNLGGNLGTDEITPETPDAFDDVG
jgi:hypothetical protein